MGLSAKPCAAAVDDAAAAPLELLLPAPPALPAVAGEVPGVVLTLTLEPPAFKLLLPPDGCPGDEPEVAAVVASPAPPVAAVEQYFCRSKRLKCTYIGHERYWGEEEVRHGLLWRAGHNSMADSAGSGAHGLGIRHRAGSPAMAAFCMSASLNRLCYRPW